MRFILLGAPGAGKGTQADFLCHEYHIPKISTGDMLRAATQEKTELGKEVEKIMKSGELVPDSTMIKLVKARIDKVDCRHGFVLDGFPRTLAQAQSLIDNDIAIDYVIEIKVADDAIVERLGGRLVHPASGRSYHMAFNPPKKAGKDDLTGEALVQREDDKEKTVRKRLSVYHDQTRPLVDFYKKLSGTRVSHKGEICPPRFLEVSGVGAVEEINEKIHHLLNTI